MRSPTRRLLLSASCLALVSLVAAAPPEVVRLRVPSDRVQTWFPPGIELKGMSAGSFEDLLRAVKAASVSGTPAEGPRLLKAKHEARWEDGILVGRTELVIDPPKSGVGALVLEPWTPAVDATEPGTAPVRSDDAGRSSIRVEPAARDGGAVKAAVAWRLRARPGSRGHKFALGLPGQEACELSLDLPVGLEPEGPIGLRQGPSSTSDPRRARWRFVGRLGTFDLRLLDPDAREDDLAAPRIWVEGATRVEVGESIARWSLDWSVSGGSRAARQLVVSLDPGLEPLIVTGPEVDDFRTESGLDGSTRVSIRLRGQGEPTTPVSIRALARVPTEGPWVVPSARAVNAVWTGGTTAVRLDPSRIVEDVRPLAGRRRTQWPPGEVAEDRCYVFEAERAGPVAELLLRKPWIDVSAEVRGQLVVGGGSPRLTCRVTWRVHRGQPQSLDVDLPPSWSADGVAIEGVDAAVSWHPEVLPGGGVRVRVASPSGEWTDRSLSLVVTATAAVAGGRGHLALPRVRPVGVSVLDEVWVARAESGVTLLPTRVRGLAWIDPPAVSPPAGTQGIVLAWRWTADDAEAWVERERAEVSPRGAVDLVASVSSSRLALDARVSVDVRDEPVRTLAIGLSEPVPEPEAWRFVEETTGIELARAPLDPRARAAAGDLGRGPAWSVELPQPQRGRAGVRIRYEGPWNGRGQIPLIRLPTAIQAKGTVLVLAGRNLRMTSDVQGVHAIDPELTAQSLTAEALPVAEPGGLLGLSSSRRAFAFAYSAPEARIELRTEALKPAAAGGVIREAVLTTLVDPDGRSARLRLSLKVVPDHAPAIEITLPPGSILERVRRDGLPLTPTMAGDALSVPLNGSGAGPLRPLAVITLDYRAGHAGSNPFVVRPERPTFSLPCLTLAWEVVVPATWGVASWGPALCPTNPFLKRSGLLDRLAVGRARGAWDSRRARRNGSATEMLRALDARVGAGRPEEVSLGEWFTRWDAGPWPVLIDRNALARAGFGPRSRVVPTRESAGKPGAVQAALRPLGLVVAPVGRTLLVTARSEAPTAELQRSQRRLSWEAALESAAAWGADTSDRFQSVGRWREEPAPRAAAVESEMPAAGRTTWRFVAPGWPDAGTEVVLVNRRQQTAWIWTVAMAVLTAGLWLRALPPAVRAAGVAALAGLGLLATAFAPPPFAGAAIGLAGGAAALAFFALGERLPTLPSWRQFRPRRFSPRRRRRAGGSSLVTPMLLCLTAAAIATPWALALAQTRSAPERDAPVLALYPFDGLPDPAKEPDRVLLRLSDYARLKAVAEANPAPTPPALVASSAVHRVSWLERRTVVIETDLTVSAERPGPAHWTFPLEDAREISATLDGDDVPVRIEPGARKASVLVNVATRDAVYRLRLRRSVTPRTGDWGDSITQAVNPIAVARMEVAGHPSGLLAEVPCARGSIEDREAGQGPAGDLGPADHIDVRWSPRARPVKAPEDGAVEGLYLWDALPAGDRVRARLTYRDPRGTSVVRLGLGPGVLVRSSTIPGTVDVTREGTPDQPEWVARIDPPLPDGATVLLDVWRPLEGVGHASGRSTRIVPRVEPMDVERLTVTLAFRRPPEWVGRIGPGLGVPGALEIVGEEAFVRSWGGSLPKEPLTLSGAVKLPSLAGKGPLPTVATGPQLTRPRVVPSVQLAIIPGRIDVSVEADLTETAGPDHEVQLSLAEGFHVVRVSADGLTDWSRPTARLLRLRFDGPPLPQRRIRVQGWLAVASDPLAPTPPSREIDIPWPRWTDQDEQPGTLTVVSATRFQLVKSPGASVVPPEPQEGGPRGGSPVRATYRVIRPADLGQIRWEVEPPRVKAQVQSQVTINPDSAEWVAVLRYDVSGGPLEAINLRLPADWARTASVRLPGVAHQQMTETRGDFTYWSIRPDRPIWGSQRLLVRSSMPFQQREVRAFPDLSLLGHVGPGGGVDTYLRIVNATRQAISVDDSPGLQSVSSASLAVDEDLAENAHRTASVTTYHVVKPGWSLRVRKAGDLTSNGADGEVPRVGRAEYTCSVATDGSLLGLARYEVGARSGAFLEVELPEGSTPLWAAVNGTPAQPLSAGRGRWEVPLAEESGSRLVLVWRSDASTSLSSMNPIALPVAGRALVPAVVTVFAPEGMEVASISSRLPATSADQVDLEKASWLARETAGMLAALDRNALRDVEDLVAALIRIELLLRQAERAAAFDPLVAPGQREDRISRSGLAANRLRALLSEALHKEALDEFATAARTYLGLGSGSETTVSVAVPTPESSTGVHVRPIGRPHAFQGDLGGVDRAEALVWSRTPGPEGAERPWIVGLVVLTLAIPLLSWLLARRPGGSPRIAQAALAAGLALVGFWAGSGWLLAGLGLAGLGRLSRSQPLVGEGWGGGSHRQV
jgi:hypothetical protein